LEVVKGLLEGNGGVQGADGMVEKDLPAAVQSVAKEELLHVNGGLAVGCLFEEGDKGFAVGLEDGKHLFQRQVVEGGLGNVPLLFPEGVI